MMKDLFVLLMDKAGTPGIIYGFITVTIALILYFYREVRSLLMVSAKESDKRLKLFEDRLGKSDLYSGFFLELAFKKCFGFSLPHDQIRPILQKPGSSELVEDLRRVGRLFDFNAELGLFEYKSRQSIKIKRLIINAALWVCWALILLILLTALATMNWYYSLLSIPYFYYLIVIRDTTKNLDASQRIVDRFSPKNKEEKQD